MAFNKSKIYKLAIKTIQENECLDIRELIALLPCQTTCFYSFFPADSKESETFKELINTNKVKACGGLKRKWIKSENATLQIAAYKLMGDEDEVHRLSGTKQETTLKGDKDNPIHFDDEVGRKKLIAELSLELGIEVNKKSG